MSASKLQVWFKGNIGQAQNTHLTQSLIAPPGLSSEQFGWERKTKPRKEVNT